jgi:hypothetical protein
MVSAGHTHAAGHERRIELDLPSQLNPVDRVAGSPTKLVSQMVAGRSCAPTVITCGTSVIGVTLLWVWRSVALYEVIRQYSTGNRALRADFRS